MELLAKNMEDGTTRTFLWCVPRSTACAFTRSLSAIGGIEVWYEPFFFSFVAELDSKRRLGIDLPTSYDGNEETFQKVADMLKSVSHFNFKADQLPYAAVKTNLSSSTNKHVFVKDMGFAVNKDVFPFIPLGFKHTFLIRHPLRVLHSNRKAMFEQLSMIGALEGDAADENKFDLQRDDPYVGPGLLFKDLYDLWQHCRQNYEDDPVVIDADDLLTKPAEVLSKYCQAVGLPYDESLLTFGCSADLDVFKIWKSPIGVEELRMTVSSFSSKAMESRAFLPANEMPSRDLLTPDVIRCADEIMEYYDEMFKCRIKV
ncbi:uncharacterized protein LOC129261289 [Lytechinus pictus]|uniref:uncharacterized protein LOC129261289 n=1 Tax=Lytechinus pictus TaxID=7653 RepID=UPI0030BA0174